MREDGRPSGVAVATAIASGIGSPDTRAVSNHRVSWVIGLGSREASSIDTVWRSSVRGGFLASAEDAIGDLAARYDAATDRSGTGFV